MRILPSFAIWRRTAGRSGSQPPSHRAPGTATRFSTTVVPAGQTELTITAWGSARLLVNAAEVGRQGGFMPYERTTPRVRRYDAA